MTGKIWFPIYETISSDKRQAIKAEMLSEYVKKDGSFKAVLSWLIPAAAAFAIVALLFTNSLQSIEVAEKWASSDVPILKQIAAEKLDVAISSDLAALEVEIESLNTNYTDEELGL